LCMVLGLSHDRDRLDRVNYFAGSGLSW